MMMMIRFRLHSGCKPRFTPLQHDRLRTTIAIKPSTPISISSPPHTHSSSSPQSWRHLHSHSQPPPNQTNSSSTPISLHSAQRSIPSILIYSFVILSLGYSIGTLYPPNPITRLIIHSIIPSNPLSRSSPSSSPTHLPSTLDPHSLQKQPIVDRIEDDLHQLQIVRELRNQPETWLSFRPFQDLDPHHLIHNLTHGTLRGPGRFAIPPLVFVNKQRTQAIAIIHVGDAMCGHDGIVHGGILATICDEGLATLAFCNLPSNIGVTASLKLDYKRPVLADQFIILRSWIPPERPPIGRKAWSDGRIENLAGDVLVQAQSLFVEPKGAKFMNKSKVKEYLKLP